MENFGVNFNVAAVVDENNIFSVGVNYHDSEDVDLSLQVDGKDINEVINTLITEFFSQYMEVSSKSEEEEEPLSELEQLKKELEQIKAERKELEEKNEYLKQCLANQDCEKVVKETPKTYCIDLEAEDLFPYVMKMLGR